MTLLEQKSELIVNIDYDQKIGDTYIEIVELKGGNAFVLSQDTIALYKNKTLINDPLGQGLIAMTAIPKSNHLPASRPWIMSYKAGFISLTNNLAILITPKSFRLYNNPSDALKNNNLICELIHSNS